jgi:hypothetical protein
MPASRQLPFGKLMPDRDGTVDHFEAMGGSRIHELRRAGRNVLTALSRRRGT